MPKPKSNDASQSKLRGDAERRLRTKRRAIRRAQDIVARHGSNDRDLVAELIAERRREAERE